MGRAPSQDQLDQADPAGDRRCWWYTRNKYWDCVEWREH